MEDNKMGRRKNNPDLVQELIDGRWTMSQTEFEEKYFSLSSSDMSKVAEAIDKMEDEFMSDTWNDTAFKDGDAFLEAKAFLEAEDK